MANDKSFSSLRNLNQTNISAGEESDHRLPWVEMRSLSSGLSGNAFA